MVWSYLWDPFDDFSDVFYHIDNLLVDHDFSFVSDDSFYDEDFSDSCSDTSDEFPFAIRSPEKKKAQQDRRRRAKEAQATRQARLLLAIVYQLSKDDSSYLSLLPHEIVSLIVSYCNCSDNDLRLMSQGFDYVGMSVTVPLPLRGLRGRRIVGGVVTGYDLDCDEHQLCLVTGERVMVQINGIGKNGCKVTFGENPNPLCNTPHPTSPDEISYNWIKHVLNCSIDIKYKIHNVAMATGDTCQACAIHIGPDGSSDSGGDLFVKFSLPHSPTAEEIWQSGCYQREAYFYGSLLENTPQSLVPRVHLVYCDFEQRHSVIVVQDMRVDAYAPDLVRGFSRYEAAKVLQSLALLHASWWDSPLLSKYFAESSRGHAHQIAFTPHHSLVRELTNALPLLKQYLRPFLHKDADYLLKNIRFIYIRFAQRPLTLCHCDVRPDHVFIPMSSAKPAVFVDWQRCGLGVAVRDVTTVLAGVCADGSQDDAWYREMIGYYFTELSRCVRGYALETDCYADFRIYTLLYMSELAVALWKAQHRASDARRVSYLEKTLRSVIHTAVCVKSFDLLRTYVETVHGMSSSDTPPAPLCFHNDKAVRRCMPSGVKQGQVFFGCPHYEIGKECSFFRWTTSSVKTQQSGRPVCILHGKFTEVRYSLLPETLGMGYYSCSEKENPCKFFKWVEDGLSRTGTQKVTPAHTSTQILCRNWTQTGYCRFGDRCHFKDSHTAANRLSAGGICGGRSAGDKEVMASRATASSQYPALRAAAASARPERERTAGPQCRYWAKSRSCPYGDRCYFGYSHM